MCGGREGARHPAMSRVCSVVAVEEAGNAVETGGAFAPAERGTGGIIVRATTVGTEGTARAAHAEEAAATVGSLGAAARAEDTVVQHDACVTGGAALGTRARVVEANGAAASTICRGPRIGSRKGAGLHADAIRSGHDTGADCLRDGGAARRTRRLLATSRSDLIAHAVTAGLADRSRARGSTLAVVAATRHGGADRQRDRNEQRLEGESSSSGDPVRCSRCFDEGLVHGFIVTLEAPAVLRRGANRLRPGATDLSPPMRKGTTFTDITGAQGPTGGGAHSRVRGAA